MSTRTDNPQVQQQTNCADYGTASNSGYAGSASNSGNYGSASNSGVRGSASTSGYAGSASNSGYAGSAEATGVCSAAVSTSMNGTARAGNHGCIALAWWNPEAERFEMCCRETGDADTVLPHQLKPHVWYRMNDAGEFIEGE